MTGALRSDKRAFSADCIHSCKYPYTMTHFTSLTHTIFRSCYNWYQVHALIHSLQIRALKPARKNQEILETRLAEQFPNFSILTSLETMNVHVLLFLRKVIIMLSHYGSSIPTI